jgi:hypothetical protein
MAQSICNPASTQARAAQIDSACPISCDGLLIAHLQRCGRACDSSSSYSTAVLFFSPKTENCMKMMTSSAIVPSDPISHGKFVRKY